MLDRKVFSPTPEELPGKDKSSDTEETPLVEATTTCAAPTDDLPAAKKLKTDSEDVDKDWEAIEKPSEEASEKGTEMSEEGEKVEAPDLSKDDGEKIEKPSDNEPLEAAAATGKALPKHGLLKDW